MLIGTSIPTVLRRQYIAQSVEECGLAFQNSFAGRFCFEPRCPVKLRKILVLARTRRPFHLEYIALQLFRIPVILCGPDMYGLAARLLRVAECNKVSARPVARLFLEFSFGCVERGLTSRDETLGNCPRAVIFFLPERSSGVSKQNFDMLAAPAEEKNAGDTLPGCQLGFGGLSRH